MRTIIDPINSQTPPIKSIENILASNSNTISCFPVPDNKTYKELNVPKCDLYHGI